MKKKTERVFQLIQAGGSAMQMKLLTLDYPAYPSSNVFLRI